MTATSAHARTTDAALRARAAAVIPGGMYGHQSAAGLPPEFPQFMARGAGARVWDVDGREYVDLMCSYGPVILGHQHPKVEAAAQAQRREADCQNAPSPRMVELAEALTGTVAHADWAMFAKNGTDATTLALMIARAATGHRKILAARGSYHGAAPWCTPRPGGVTAEDRAHISYFTYNDLASAQQAADAVAGDLAGVIVTPFRHDIGQDQELADPQFARGLRELCDRTGAALILDDVRCGFRLHLGSSWEPLGVAPDLSAWSKAIANGYALAAVLGGEAFRHGATEVFTTGSFWFSAVSMAAGLATLEALAEQDAVATMTARGQALRDGLAEQAARRGLAIRQTGPPQMPFLTFAGDAGFALANTFAGEAARRGAFLHPRHNWFVSAATTPADLDLVLDATDHAFAAVRRHIDAGLPT
ncbi:MAG TPA: aminotransferase class III-fold pyridoxal phosphate-dependent enzyme [Streptosporangiaceae bacterium]|jgi:glutamate-1-semialdehyde 2,1-aminomutase|nr:aminotransferase class III-fold pyridoxal phosphate-dependent enzyme [Streptosporangiaceae bacterium]